jgi:S-DNA-T family DNA segregation ATPase FtsK/SpoIIIE
MPTKTSKVKPEEPAAQRSARLRRTTPTETTPPPPTQTPLLDWRATITELSEHLTVELLGLLFVVAGGFCLLSALSSDLAWVERMLGWSAYPTGLLLLTLGSVLMLGERAGYWSAEALVGAQLLLFALQAGAYAWNNSVPRWPVLPDGRFGGVVGWALGSLLISALGQWPTLFLLVLAGGAGALLLLRFTPLVYPVAGVVRLVPFLHSLWRRLARLIDAWLPLPASSAAGDPTEDDLPADPPAHNFVAPHPSSHQPSPNPRTATASAPIADLTVEVSDRTTLAPSQERRRSERATPPSRPQSTGETANTPNAAPIAPKPPPKPKPLRAAEALPAPELLQSDVGSHTQADVRALQAMIENTLEDFNVPVRVVHVESGPTVTQFGVEPLYLERAGQRRKVRVSRIVNLADDLALALAAPAVRIEAPVPGRPYVGIEVPNPEKTMVGLRGILESPVMRKEGGLLPLALGRNTAGSPVVLDLVRTPHILIAGATGSGKSVCINTIIVGLLMQHGPETLRFVMVDPKMVELPGYNGIPHLLGKVITEVDHVMGALTWLLLQMDDRYRLFREVGVRNILAYNERARKQRKGETQLEPLPYIVLVIDELADLMMTAAEDIERQICRLAQMARATGIHLVLATQRPSVDVVTGLIKANFPTRIAFAVTSQTDSRVILDSPGAERLLGRGDMLVMRSDSPSLQRVQGCYVSDDEIGKVVAFWKGQIAAPPGEMAGGENIPWQSLLEHMEEDDQLVLKAIEILRGANVCSASLLQRKLQLGYPKASRLIEILEERGIIGPDQGGGRGREVLLKKEEEIIFGAADDAIDSM